MISIDDHPPPDPSSSDYHNHHQQQVSHDLKINNGEKAPASVSVSDIDLLKPTDAYLDDTNNRLPNFSIRDYVFGSRCNDNITCNWPFSGESLQLCLDYGVKNFLPPFESLDSLRSNSSVNNEEIITSFNSKSKDDDHPLTKPQKTHNASSQPAVVNFILSETTMAAKVCPVCKTFSSSSNTTLNAHIDRCLSEESKSNMKWSVNPNPSKIIVKHRIKPRKTRLMVEIYKTAPRCTVEELDRRNGTNWATNSSFPDQEFECQEEEEKAFIQDHEGAVYIDTNGTKVRILSMPEIVTLEARKLQKGSKILMEKKKKKVYLQKGGMKSLNLSPKSKKLSSLKPHLGVSKARSCKKDDGGEKPMKVHKQLNNLAITRPPWACSKRSVLAKKFNGKNGSVATNECLVESDKCSDNMSCSQSSKKARTQLTNGIKFASLKPNVLSVTQENNSGSKINLKRKSLDLKKLSENDEPFQDSLRHKSRMEEEEDTSKNSSFDMENVFEVNKKKSITSKSSDGDSLESTRTEIPSHSIHFQGSFMGLRNSLDDEFSKFELQESMENIHNIEDDMDDIIEKQRNYFQEVDPIPIPGPPGSFLPPSPGGDIISEQLQANNSSLTTTITRVQSTEYHHPHPHHHHHHHHDHMINRDFMSESPNSTISSPSFVRSDDKFSARFTSLQDPNLGYTDVMVDKKSATMASSSFKNDHPCCCSRKEAVFPKSIASYPRQSVVSRDESIKFPVYRDCESAIISPSAAPVLRLMGKNLTVVNTDDHIVDQFRPPPCSSSMSHHQQLHNIQNNKNSFFHGYPSQHPAIFNHNQNGSLPQHFNVHPPNNSRNLADLRHIHPCGTMFPSRNGFMAPEDCLHRLDMKIGCDCNGDLGRWGCTQTGSSSILHPTSHGSSLAFIPHIRSSSTSYYPPSFS